MQSDTAALFGDLIDDDLECVGCGYNLRSLARDSNCPECAAPVMDSLVPFLPTFRFRRCSAIRWMRVGLALWMLSIFAWAAGICYCTFRVVYAVEVLVGARWSYYSLIQGDFAWIVEVIALLCVARGLAIEMRGSRRSVACAAALVGTFACLLGVLTTYLIFTRRQAMLSGFGSFTELFTELGRPAALVAIAVLLLLAVRPKRSVRVRIAICALIAVQVLPLLVVLYEVVRAIAPNNTNVNIRAWYWWAFGRPAEATYLMITALALMIVDRGLRMPKPDH